MSRGKKSLEVSYFIQVTNWPGSMPYLFICFRIIIQKAIVTGHMKSDLFFPARKKPDLADWFDSKD